MKELSFEKMERIEGGKLTAENLICNINAGGITAIWSFWGGGIALALGATALAATGVGVVISIVGGAVLSSVLC